MRESLSTTLVLPSIVHVLVPYRTAINYIHIHTVPYTGTWNSMSAPTCAALPVHRNVCLRRPAPHSPYIELYVYVRIPAATLRNTHSLTPQRAGRRPARRGAAPRGPWTFRLLLILVGDRRRPGWNVDSERPTCTPTGSSTELQRRRSCCPGGWQFGGSVSSCRSARFAQQLCSHHPVHRLSLILWRHARAGRLLCKARSQAA